MLKTFFRKNKVQLIIAGLIFGLSTVLVNTSLINFQASVLGKTHAPYDGLVAPVEKVPDWVNLTSEQWKLNYADIDSSKLISLPTYNPDDLKIPFSKLNWNVAADKAIRNAQVTFSVVYMGNYKLDGVEFAGSHLAVDIKIPKGTPIRAIGNGVVIKATNITSGFGNHVVIRHDNFPSFDSPGVTTTYYSNYAHMDSLAVKEGDVVTKGQLIGYSGMSGTATTPHLHFQIDNDKAPWHPYWPFTTKEASDAGYGFFDAINAGLGKEKAMETTINPMLYIQKYAKGSASTTTSSSSSTTTSNTSSSSSSTSTVNASTSTPSINDELPPTTSSTVTSVSENTSANLESTNTAVNSDVIEPEIKAQAKLASFRLKYSASMAVKSPELVKVYALDEQDDVISNFSINNEISIVIDNGSATLSKTYLKSSDFVYGIAEFTITPQSEFGLRFSVKSADVSASSDMIHPSNFSDITAENTYFEAVNFLKEHEVMKGYADGTIQPEKEISRVEALKMIYVGLNLPTKLRVVLEYKDTDSKAWYARYVAQAQIDNVVQGYSGNVFKPANSVTRAEYIKMLLASAAIDVSSVKMTRKPYDDVDVTAWYAKQFAKAKEMNLIDSTLKSIKPNEAITRGEVADILYRMIVAKINGKNYYSSQLVASNAQARAFFAN